VISPRRFAIMTAACGIAAVAGFSLAGIKNPHTPAIEEPATTTGEAGSEAQSTAAAVAAFAEAGLLDASQTLPFEAQPEQIAAMSTPDPVYAEEKDAASSAKEAASSTENSR